MIVPPLSLGLLNLPFYAAQTMGPDGYLAPILAAIMALPGWPPSTCWRGASPARPWWSRAKPPSDQSSAA